jgi:hypothetical protein
MAHVCGPVSDGGGAAGGFGDRSASGDVVLQRPLLGLQLLHPLLDDVADADDADKPVRWSTVSAGVHVATIVVMISDTGRLRMSPPCSCSLRTTSRSETMPTTPSGPTTTMAPMLCNVSSLSSPDTEVSGVIVATAAPLFRNTSAIRIVASAPIVIPVTTG